MKCLMILCAATIILCAALQDNGNEPMEDGSDKHCTVLDSDSAINTTTAIRAMMGTWHGTQLITHDGREEGFMQYRSCAVLHLTLTRPWPVPGTKPPHKKTSWRIRQLKLIWGEAEHSLKFTLSFNSTRPGIWMCSERQIGSMTRPELRYKQFAGIVQVVKATGTLLVLTFCEPMPGGQLYTVVLQRAPPTIRASEEVRSIRNLLRQYGLPIYSVRKMCRNGTAGPAMGSLYVLLVLAAVLLVLMKNYY
ncbi:uncharacterized protein LOC128276679 [Anopheles cruzii]|uniref:uncharacterized protein LOC128276679 n=1 Tax=Anopheles cruzii TaxID=68878 RepID=UPI0022EC601A|nr:uncharacterized protein LOC128276679 [Anopheles cruzii]